MSDSRKITMLLDKDKAEHNKLVKQIGIAKKNNEEAKRAELEERRKVLAAEIDKLNKQLQALNPDADPTSPSFELLGRNNRDK